MKFFQTGLKIFLAGIFFFYSAQLFAQRKVKPMDSDKEKQEEEVKGIEHKDWKENMRYGGGVFAMFGSSYSYFYIQPFVAHQIREKLLAGVGVTYIYWSNTYSFSGATHTISDNAFGINFFANQTLVGPLALHVEYLPMNFTTYNYNTNSTKRIWGQSFYVGGGLMQSHSYLLVLYDLNWEAYDPYRNFNAYAKSFRNSPIDIRIGFIF